MARQTLYDKYGGFANISRVVMAFYDALLDSEEIGPFFDDIDMRKLVDHQTKFISSLLGGPAAYTDDRLRQVHAHLDVRDDHFDEMKKVLRGTLDSHDFAPEDADEIIAAFEARRGLIVT